MTSGKKNWREMISKTEALGEKAAKTDGPRLAGTNTDSPLLENKRKRMMIMRNITIAISKFSIANYMLNSLSHTHSIQWNNNILIIDEIS